MPNIDGRRGRPPVKREERSPLAEIVTRYRDQKGWTQGQLALYAGVSRSFINQLESGRYKTAEPPTLQKIADALSAPLHEFLEAAGVTDAPYRAVAPHLPSIEQLRTEAEAEGAPPALLDLLQDMERNQNTLNDEGWLTMARVFRGLVAQQQQEKRRHRSQPPAPLESHEEQDQPGPSEGRISARGRLRRAHI